MKRIVLLLLGLLLALPQFAQERKYSTFYEQRATLFEELPVTSKDIIFLGNSITNGCEWAELFQNKNVKNRGISGDICMGVYDRLDPIVKGKPAKIFLLDTYCEQYYRNNFYYYSTDITCIPLFTATTGYCFSCSHL